MRIISPELTSNTSASAIDATIAPAVVDPVLIKKLTDVCPVNIFAQEKDGRLRIVEENLDECVLCELCVQAAPPKGVIVRKLYSGEVLER